MLRGKNLRGVFAAADGINIQRFGHRFAKPNGVNLGVEAAHTGALAQYEGVAVIAVGTEDIGKY